MFYDVYEENMFTIEIEDGCKAPYKPIVIKNSAGKSSFWFDFKLKNPPKKIQKMFEFQLCTVYYTNFNILLIR